MKILEAQVRDNADLSERGKILVYCQSLSENFIPVTYTTPYNAGFEGGFIAIPEIGEQILICQPDNSLEWYYLNTIVSPNPGIPSLDGKHLKNSDQLISDESIYKARGVPQKMIFSDTRGNKLSLKSLANSKFINISAELKSAVGKKLLLSDSPKMDCVILRNEHGDSLKITSRADVASAARSIELQSRGPQKLISRESQIDLIVRDGREINIENDSTGLNANPVEPNKFGNINISSKNKDINITVYEENGKIFIDSLGNNGLIQIDSGGKVTIWAEDKVEIRSKTEIKLKSDGDLSLNAAGNINIKSDGNINLEASKNLNMRSSGNVNADGNQVHFNSGNSSPANSIDVEKQSNSYGN